MLFPSAPVATTSAAGTAHTVTTPAIDTTGANLLIVFVAMRTTTTLHPTVTDSKGNLYIEVTGRTVSVSGETYTLYLLIARSPVVGSGHTITAAGTDINPSIVVEAWAHARVAPISPIVLTTSAADSDASTLLAGLTVPAALNLLFVTGAFFLDNSSGAVSVLVPSGEYTVTDTVPWGATNQGASMAYTLLRPPGPTVFIQWGFTNVTSRVAMIVLVLVPMPDPPVPSPLGWMAPSTVVVAGR